MKSLRTLQAKFIFGILPVVVIVAVLFSAIFAVQNYRQMRQALTTKHRVLPDVYSIALAALSSTFEPASIARVIGSLALDPDVAQATVLDDEDTVLAQIDAVKLEPAEDRKVIEQMIVDDTRAGRLNIKGKIQVVFHERALDKSMRDGLVRDGSLVMLLVSAIVLAAVIANRIIIGRPLEHLLRAIETHQLGGEVSPLSGLLTQETRKRIAYHEAGHALVGHWLNAGVVERVTIEPRGQALGVTYITRENEDPLYKQSELTSRLSMTLAGRETELLVFDSVSSGASDDLKRASELAIKMVGSLGFSDAFGLLSVAGVPPELLGPDIQGALLKEARALLEKSQATCQRLLRGNRPRLDAMAARLLERDVLSGDELRELLGSQITGALPA